MSLEEGAVVIDSAELLFRRTTRRSFLRAMGVGGSIVFLPGVFAACTTDDNNVTGTTNTSYTLDLSTDTGILNYAYALEQLEAAFYTTAIASTTFAAMSASDQEVIADLQKHELIHREFFKALLGSSAIPQISFNATTVGNLMKDRATLLSTSQLLEDTGVSAYNGAGKYLTSAANLLIAGKIVSVEARHSAAIRDIRDPGSGRLFAGDDVVSATGLDVKAEPSAVISSVVGLGVVNGSLTIGVSPDATKKTQPDAPAPTPT